MKRISFIQIIAALSIMLFFTQCTWDQVIDEPIVVEDISFADDIIPIFNASCNTTGCHITGTTAPDLTPGNAYNALHDGGYINIASPSQSILYKWMNDEESIPMPLSGVNAEYNAKVLQWITEGAEDN